MTKTALSKYTEMTGKQMQQIRRGMVDARSAITFAIGYLQAMQDAEIITDDEKARLNSSFAKEALSYSYVS